jgi:quercetin dioxygenase-like cupin family protein
MTDDLRADVIEFDDTVVLALASLVTGPAAPRPEVRERLLASLPGLPRPPGGFSFRFASDADWLPHPVPGIRMKVLALNRAAGYTTLLLDVAPGTRFPPHHHAGAEECYVLSGSLYTCDRRMTAGDFLHADANTDHGELWTEEGCRVLLVVPPEDYLPDPPR